MYAMLNIASVASIAMLCVLVYRSVASED